MKYLSTTFYLRQEEEAFESNEIELIYSRKNTNSTFPEHTFYWLAVIYISVVYAVAWKLKVPKSSANSCQIVHIKYARILEFIELSYSPSKNWPTNNI